MGKWFGTDGVRGVANQDLTCELAFAIGKAGALALGKTHRPTLLVGRDTRISGDMLECALVAGICSTGAHALVAGVIPTPAIGYLTQHHHCDAGFVISASHNALEDNGIKLFDHNGFKLPDQLEDEIERIMEQGNGIKPPTGIMVGRRIQLKNGFQEYVDYLLGTTQIRLDGLHVVLDCANGAASDVAPEIFKRLGAHVDAYYNLPDGANINGNCGSTYPERLQQLVIELGADVGLAFDGDADRLIAVDEHGMLVDGDHILMICGTDMAEKGLLKDKTIVATIMSNLGLEISLKERGIRLVRAQVGDRYVMEIMRKHGYNLGGEQSGHVVFLDHSTTGDGVLSGIQLLSVMSKSGRKLSELSAQMVELPQVLINVRLTDETKLMFQTDEAFQNHLRAVEADIGERGRVIVRASGTEPKVRVMIEGENREQIEQHANDLAEQLKTQFS